jgi:hypothetical protein
MLIEDPETLKSWLISVLQPLCEADPEALAKYVLALIKKDKSDEELKKICVDQLDVFLASNTKSFVDKLFLSLKEKTYNIKSTESNKPAVKVEEEVESSSRKRRSRSRSPRRSDSSNRPSAGRRHIDRSAIRRNEEPKSSTNSSKYSFRGRERRSTSRSRSPSPSKNQKRPISRSRSRSPPQQTRKRSASRSPERDIKRKERCRDFDEKGVCLRGDLCPFDHGSDPVVLDAATGPIFGLNRPPVTAVMPQPLVVPPTIGSRQWQEYDPVAPSMDLRPPNMMIQGPSIPRHPGNWNGRHTQQFSPRPPLMGLMPPQPGRPNLTSVVVNMTNPEEQVSIPEEVQPPPQFTHNNNSNTLPSHNANNEMALGDNRGHPPMRATNRGRGGFGRGRGRGFGRMNGPPRMHDQPEKCTLEVRRLPANLNSISALNEYFSKFGTIVNLQVRYQGDPEAAVVQFSSHAEASAAHRCPEAVLNNRFIKLFWHNKEQEKQDPAPEKETETDDIRTSSTSGRDSKKEEQSEIDKDRVSVKDRLDIKPPEDMTFPPKASRPVLNPNLLRKSNVDKNSAETPVVPMIKTRSEQKKEKLLKNIEIRKKAEQLLLTLRKDQTSVGEKLINAKSKEERIKLKSIFDLLDAKRKETEEELKKISEELLNDCSGHGKPMRGRRGHHMPRGGHVSHVVKKEVRQEKKVQQDEEDDDEKPLPGEADDGGRAQEEDEELAEDPNEILEDPLPAVSSQE